MPYSLTDPLKPGQTVDRWALSETTESLFDVPETPMQGDMDAGFFLTEEKNYIPHEYPCRTIFAEQYRNAEPEPATAFEPARWWVPFGADRVDLSGFWFRATFVETWAETTVFSAHDQSTRWRLSTCGAAVIFVNGQAAAWLAPYKRNMACVLDVTLPLKAGENEVRIWFADLCERDTRYFFILQLLEGDGLESALPIPVVPERAHTLEAMLDGMHFDRPWYDAGDVTIVFGEEAIADLAVTVDVHGDFISDDHMAIRHDVPRGANRLSIARTQDLPADYRHFTITLKDESFSLSRGLGVEIVHDSGEQAPDDIQARAAEALDHVARNAEADGVCALARLATDQGGVKTDAMIAACLGPIDACHDCADFQLVPLLWGRIRWGARIGQSVRERLDATILKFRYWMDEPGNDVMWYFSENHALLYHTACYLAGDFFADARFERSGRSGLEQRSIGAERLRAWFDHFEACEMAEWNSAPYFPIDLKGLGTLAALAPDADIRERAERAIHRLIRIVAMSAHKGILTASQGRSYEHSLQPARTLELSALARLIWGKGWFGRRFHALPQMALLIRDHAMHFDPALKDHAYWSEKAAHEWRFRQGKDGFAAIYHYKSGHFAMGSVAHYKPGTWGYQETVLHARMDTRPEAQIWINHPGEVLQGGYARPSYWGGCGILPRVHQYRSCAVLGFEIQPDQPDFTHVWVPEAAFDEVVHDEQRVWLRIGETYAMIYGNAPLIRVSQGPSAGCEYRLPGRNGVWIVRLSDTAADADLTSFRTRLSALQLEKTDRDVWLLHDPGYGLIRCEANGVVTAENRTLDPAQWTMEGEVTRLGKP